MLFLGAARENVFRSRWGSTSANESNASERIGRAAADGIQVIVAAAIPANFAISDIPDIPDISDIVAIPAISVIPAITDIPVTGMAWHPDWDGAPGAGCRFCRP